ncbi:hypothetical protein AX17_003691 [Amanita inopinata Kibby_2008]|nr:hypothetical protein AX17_003691 [Amanita inopinata Kibby_2008]
MFDDDTGRRILAESSNLDILPDRDQTALPQPVMNTKELSGTCSERNPSLGAPPTTTNYADNSSLQLLSVPFYFTSPLTTLLESLHDPDHIQIGSHDIMEAYSCFSYQIHSVAHPLMQAKQTPAALRIVKEHSSELVQVLKRDLNCTLRDSSPHSHNPFSLHTWESNVFSEDDLQYAVDSATLAQHALCFLSDICIFESLYSLFSDSDLQSILDDVFAIISAPSLPVPNGSRLCTFIVSILRTQRLPAEVLLLKKENIYSILDGAIRGDFGAQSIVDGLKAVHTFLIRHEMLFFHTLSDLLSIILNHLVNDSADIRLQAVYALSGFAFALRASDGAFKEALQSICSTIRTFIDCQYDKSSNGPQGALLPDIIVDAMSSKMLTRAGHGPCYALVLVSSLIVLLGHAAFFHAHCMKLIFTTLSLAVHHKRSSIRGLHVHVWKTLIWAYVRISTTEDDGDIDNVSLSDIKERAFRVVAQESRNDIGVALVMSLLGDSQTIVHVGASTDPIGNAYKVVKNMLSSPDPKIRQTGFSLFERVLNGTGKSMEMGIPLARRSQGNWLLSQILFDGSLLNVNVDALHVIIPSIPPISVDMVRQLNSQEICDNWGASMDLWLAAAQIMLAKSEFQFSDTIISIWISLLEMYVQVYNSQSLSSSPTALSTTIARVVSQLFNSSDLPHFQVRSLQFVKKLWSMTKDVLYDTWLPPNAEIILTAVLKHKFALDNDGVKSAWGNLCTDLISIGIPTLLHVVYFKSEQQQETEVLRQLWSILARTWQIINCTMSWEDLVTLAVIPFRAWKMSTQEFEHWENLLQNAFHIAEYASHSPNAVVRLFFERLGSSKLDALTANPSALYCILRHVNISDRKKLNSKLFRLVNNALLALYPPVPELLASCIDLLCVMGELITTCSDKLLVDLIKTTQTSFCRWILDEENILLDTEKNIIINAVYCNTLDRLCYQKPTLELLKALSPFLVAVFNAKQIPEPALGPLAFENFWRATYHEINVFRGSYPEDVKACLKTLSLAWGNSSGGSLVSSSESQKTPPSVVPDSQATPQNQQSRSPHNSGGDQAPLRNALLVISRKVHETSDGPAQRPSSAPLFHQSLDLDDEMDGPKITPLRRSEEDAAPSTPMNRHHTPAGAHLRSILDETPTQTPRAFAREGEPEVHKGKKRGFSSEKHVPVKRRRFSLPNMDTPVKQSISSSPQLPILPHKALSEPALESSTSVIIETHSISQPNPSRKHKLFEYVDLQSV